ncbi:Hypothetical protein FKW44_017245 [Caligus rogercresseyi]|uniref:Uncharacterized protein n=1 Tax=Caligus rogercresseyi TaxID=217165 RepID=A0A7T8H326_CALRO|nr:Hypothetical protein FKW44_017245 [Caligus rogercresseyi]
MKQARKLEGALMVKACCYSFRARIRVSSTQKADGLNKQNLHIICTSILMSK